MFQLLLDLLRLHITEVREDLVSVGEEVLDVLQNEFRGPDPYLVGVGLLSLLLLQIFHEHALRQEDLQHLVCHLLSRFLVDQRELLLKHVVHVLHDLCAEGLVRGFEEVHFQQLLRTEFVLVDVVLELLFGREDLENDVAVEEEKSLFEPMALLVGIHEEEEIDQLEELLYLRVEEPEVVHVLSEVIEGIECLFPVGLIDVILEPLGDFPNLQQNILTIEAEEHSEELDFLTVLLRINHLADQGGEEETQLEEGEILRLGILETVEDPLKLVLVYFLGDVILLQEVLLTHDEMSDECHDGDDESLGLVEALFEDGFILILFHEKFLGEDQDPEVLLEGGQLGQGLHLLELALLHQDVLESGHEGLHELLVKLGRAYSAIHSLIYYLMKGKRKQFLHNGQLIYEWDQTLEDVFLYLQPPKWALKKYEAENKKQFGPNFTTQKIVVTIRKNQVVVGVQNQKPFMDEQLTQEVREKESFWQIEDDELVI